MDVATREHLFEPFYSTKGADGNGLGLASVMGTVMQHGGVVEFDTDPGEGTTFHVHLPVSDEAPMVVLDPSGSDGPDARRDGTETILVVEDHDQLRDVVEISLSGRGYTVLSAPDGIAALDVLALHDGHIDLLVTDVVMPGMNGRELYEEASESRPDLKVLFMSGYSDDVISLRGVLDSGIHFIAKPFLEDELLAKVVGLLTPVS